MKKHLKMFTEFRGVTVEPTMGGSLSLHGCKAYYAAHAINSHDELVEMNRELLAAMELISSGFVAKTAPEQHLMDIANSAIAKAKAKAKDKTNGGAK